MRFTRVICDSSIQVHSESLTINEILLLLINHFKKERKINMKTIYSTLFASLTATVTSFYLLKYPKLSVAPAEAADDADPPRLLPGKGRGKKKEYINTQTSYNNQLKGIYNANHICVLSEDSQPASQPASQPDRQTDMQKSDHTYSPVYAGLGYQLLQK
jgi:hypothetical protein